MSQSAETPASKTGAGAAPGTVETLAIAGSGTIACGVAVCVALQGDRPVVWARSPGSAERARAEIERECARLERPDAGGGVQVTEDLDDFASATLVIEAVSEEEQVKHSLFERLSDRLRDGCLIATTTSSLSISSLATASGRPSRFFGLHVFNPVRKMELVELCFPSLAEAETRERAHAFCEAIEKTAVEVPDESGFVVNRLLFPYLFDAVRLLERTGLEPEQVDACMKLGASHPMGPLELLDLVGLDVADAIGEALHAETGEAAHRPPGRIKSLVREGKLGRKAGAGFYSY